AAERQQTGDGAAPGRPDLLLLAQRYGPAHEHPGHEHEQDRPDVLVHRTPLVEGMSSPSILVAALSARARALNWASMTWCASGFCPGLQARRTLTCRQIFAWWAKDSRM